MTDPNSSEQRMTDSALVALLHGELTGDQRRSTLDKLRRDPAARERLAALEATDALLGEALDRDSAPRPAATGAGLLRPLLAVAALLAVIAVFAWPPIERADEAAGNEHFALSVAPRGGAESPLFTDAALELFWHNKNTHEPKRPIRVMPMPFGKTVADISKAVDRGTHIGTRRMAVLPVVLRAKITPPDGPAFEARWAPASDKFFAIGDERAQQTVRLRDFEVQYAGMRPKLVGGPSATEWTADRDWGHKHLPRGRNMRWFPELPGEYRIELAVESIPAPNYMPWPTWEEPIVTTTAIVMTGQVTPWGQPHDGMRARLIWSSGTLAADSTPFALQLENVGKEARRYNYAGSTIAKIPQPLHFTLQIDGVDWQQRRGIPLMIAAVDTFQPHPVSAKRSFVVQPDYWRNDGKKLSELPGKHRVQLLFDFRPSVWNAADTSIWHGKLQTPELMIEVQANDK